MTLLRTHVVLADTHPSLPTSWNPARLTVQFGCARHHPGADQDPPSAGARTDIREALLDSALVEFGAKGFDGASI
jgi:hypothetical protein